MMTKAVLAPVFQRHSAEWVHHQWLAVTGDQGLSRDWCVLHVDGR